VRIQQARVLYQRFVTTGVPPEVPAGILDVTTAYQRVAADLAAIDEPLGTASTPESLLQLPLDEVPERLAALARDSDVLTDLQDRTAVAARLRDQDLGPLLEDLAGRHVPAERVGAELELAWWKSVLERMLAEDQALLGANTSVLDRLEQDFTLVDEAHAQSNAKRLAWQLADAWRLGLDDWPHEADALRQLLQARIEDPAVLHREAPHLLRLLAPVWLASPYDLPALGDLAFDTVLIVDAGTLSFAEGIGAIRRAPQVVAFGDPVLQTPVPFEIAVREHPDSAAVAQRVLDDRHADSVFGHLSDLVPTLELTTSYRAGGEDLVELVNRRFYEGRIESVPWAGTFLGHGSLVLDYVDDGHGMPDAESGAVESVDAEVQRVVERVLEHATNRSRESLLVVSGSAKHAARVQQAVLKARAALVLVRRGLQVFRRPKLGAWAAFTQIVAWAIQWFACYTLLVALGLGHVGLGAAAAVLFAVNVTAALPATPSNIGVFQAACVAVLAAYGVNHTDALAYGIILQAVEIATAFAMGMPALVREGMSWKDLRLRALHSSPVELAVSSRSDPAEAEA
jgi:hypothetical protein